MMLSFGVRLPLGSIPLNLSIFGYLMCLLFICPLQRLGPAFGIWKFQKLWNTFFGYFFMVAYELTMFSLSDIFLLTFLVTGVSWRRRLLFIFFMIATVQKLFGEFLILMVPTTSSFLPSNNGFPNNFLHLMEAYLLVLVGEFGELGIQRPLTTRSSLSGIF